MQENLAHALGFIFKQSEECGKSYWMLIDCFFEYDGPVICMDIVRKNTSSSLEVMSFLTQIIADAKEKDMQLKLVQSLGE
jgi:hypothetical protein